MNSFYFHSLNTAKEKYFKFKRRLEKKISSGQFDTLPRKKKNQLISRVGKYKARLDKLGFSMKGAAVAGSVTAMAAIPAIGHAQNPNIYLRTENYAYTGGETPQQMELANLDSDSDLELLVSVPGGAAKLLNRAEVGGETSWSRQDVTALNNMRNEFVVGDVDGDLDNDVIFRNGRNFYLALNDGEGNFQLSDDEYTYFSSPTYYGSFGGETSIGDMDLVDFDSDNDLDLVVGITSNSLTVFRNDGAGNFTKGSLPVSGNYVTDFEFTDLDGDGDMDLVSNSEAGEAGRSVYASENVAGVGLDPDFTSGFEAGMGYTFDDFVSVTIFDADGDGDNDVFFHRSDYSYLYGYLNQDVEGTTGTFTGGTTFTTIPQSSSFSVETVGVADFDLDGDDDLLLGLGSSRAYLASFNGTNFDGRSLAGGVIGGFYSNTYDVAIGDIDGDGVDDFVANYGSSWLALVYDRAAPYVNGFAGDIILNENDPAGTLVGYLSLYDRQGDAITIEGIQGDDAAAFSIDTETGAITTAQVFDWEIDNNDFNFEIVLNDGVKSSINEANLKLANLAEEGHGTFSDDGVPMFGTSTPVAFVAGDFDVDGDHDLFKSSNTGGGGPREALAAAFQNSLYSQTQGFFTPQNAGGGKYAIEEAIFFDVDNDGRKELIGGEYGGRMDVFYFNEYGQGLYSSYNGNVGSAQQFEIGDFDGDGADDVAMVRDNGSIYLSVFERYDLGESPLDETSTIVLSNDGNMAIGDFDGDGFDDIFLATSNYDDVIYFGRNDGGEGPIDPTPTTAVTANDYGLSMAVAADFDGDGDDDIALLRNTSGSGVSIDILDNDGGAVFSVVQTLNIGGESVGVDGDLAIGDFDGDGSPDLIATFKSSYDITTFSYTYDAISFVNDGSGSFEQKQSIADVGGLDIELMDVDSDDDLDLLISNTEPVFGCCAVELGEDNGEYIRVFLNTNAAPTGIDLSIGAFDEGAPIGESIGTLSVIDPNLGDTHTIFLTAGDGSNDVDNNKFVVDGDQLIVIKNIAFEDDALLNIHVKAIDNFGKSVTESFILTVNNVNTAPTGISISATSIDENVAPGTSVASLSADDVDAGDTHEFALVFGDGSNDADNNKFTIQDNDLVLIQNLSFDSQQTLNINVIATDSFGESITQAFTISVNNILGLDDESTNVLGVYPNPGKNQIHIRMENGTRGNLSVIVSDLNGKTIHQIDSEKSSNGWSRKFDMTSAEAGIYIIEVQVGEQVYSQRWIKQD